MSTSTDSPGKLVDWTPPERRTTYMWNVHELYVPWANAFWLGWAHGFAKTAKPGSELRKLNLGFMYNAELYDLGLKLGAADVNARDAMAHLVSFSQNMAMLREKRVEAQLEDLPDDNE